MHPKALLDACAELVGLVIKFDHPADSVVSRYFREHRSLGPRERATLAETAYGVLRRKLRYDHFAPSGSGPRERRLAILGFAGPRDFLKSALSEPEKAWLDACDAVRDEDLLERHRHNLPEWLVAPLKAQVGEGFMALATALNEPAPLDLRVNALQARREDLRKELREAGIASEPTPYSPWGLRLQDKPAYASTQDILKAFSAAVDKGQSLRLALRQVTDLSIDPALLDLLRRIATELGSPLKAWAVYLLWAHEAAEPAQRLATSVLALIEERLQSVEPDAITRAKETFGSHHERGASGP